MARFSLAIDRPAKKDGNRETDFINIVAWRGLAKICGEYLKKGKLIAVEGRLQLRKYKDKNGQTKTFAEVVASNMQMLDYKFFKKTESSSETSDDSGSDIELIEATKSSK
ncbi:MAG: single-stranded DNA-binding protein [Candidatus Saganbacteria bacterium]|nr:single-stranded DNA-binding protein [Candidatus Saganbacteria bacterium]